MVNGLNILSAVFNVTCICTNTKRINIKKLVIFFFITFSIYKSRGRFFDLKVQSGRAERQ